MAEENSMEATENGGKKLSTVLMILHIIATGVLCFFLFQMDLQVKDLEKRVEEKQVTEAKIEKTGQKLMQEEDQGRTMGPLVDIGTIRVNLVGSDNQPHRLMTRLNLEVDSEETRREAESKIRPIRYHLTRLLSSRRPEEMIGPEQMEIVRKSMCRRADAILSSERGKVLNVWPDEWIVE
jgi:flagellar basal body-associated protein FliL